MQPRPQAPVGAAEAGIVEILDGHVSEGPLIDPGSSGAYGTSRHWLVHDFRREMLT